MSDLRVILCLFGLIRYMVIIYGVENRNTEIINGTTSNKTVELSTLEPLHNTTVSWNDFTFRTLKTVTGSSERFFILPTGTFTLKTVTRNLERWTATMPTPKIYRTDYIFNETLSPREDAWKAYEEICAFKHACNHSLQKQQKEDWVCFTCPPCSCSENCHIFGTCCPDRAIVKANLSKENLGFIEEKSDETMSCQRLSPKPCSEYVSMEKNKPEKAMMVSRCPLGYTNLTIKDMCEGNIDLGDMTKTFFVSSRTNGLTYRNIHCSRCHGVPDSDIEFWNPSVVCKDITTISRTRNFGQLWEKVMSGDCCVKTAVPPRGIEPEYCWWSSDVIDRCNVTGHWGMYEQYVEQMCLQPLVAVVIRRERHYKNVYCASCNGLLYPTLNEGCRFYIITEGTYSFAALLNFNPRIATRERIVEARSVQLDQKNCTDVEVRNPLTSECSAIQCESRFQYVPSSRSCEAMFTSVRGLGYKVNVRLEPIPQPMLIRPRIIAQGIFMEAYAKMRNFGQFFIQPMIIVVELTEKNITVSPNSNVNVRALNVSINLRVASYKNHIDFENDLNQKFFTNWALNFAKPYTFTAHEIEDCYDRYFNNAKMTTDPSLYYEKNSYINECEGVGCKRASTDYVNYKNRLDCPHVEFNMTDVSITRHRDNIVIKMGNYTFRSVNGTDYAVCVDSIRICISLLLKATIMKTERVRKLATIDNDRALIVVSIVATTISLVCLLLTFVTYCIFKELRTLPGLNTMALIANLFAAQIVFQMGIKPTGNDAVCRFLGIFIHYLWMSSFSWMAVCAFHMFTVFRNVLLTNTGEVNTKRFVSYILCGNLLPIIIPVTCVLYHRFSNNDENLGYGGWICFLNTPENIAYFFAVPLGFILCLNTIFFSVTILSIRKLPDVSSTNRKNHGHVCVYIKMSALLGLTWVIGLVAAALGSTVLWYIFTIINASQGVFIFMSYIAKKRIFNSYREHFSSTPSTHSSSKDKTKTSYNTNSNTVEDKYVKPEIGANLNGID